MPDYGHPLLFGAFVTPDARNPHRTTALARAADTLGLDILGVQDHPYQAGFLDTWTLLSSMASQTERLVLFPDVLSTPLRQPAVLARSAVSLDLLSGGRVEIGLGAGGVPEGIAAMGGPLRTPGESVAALEEAIAVMRALWGCDGPVHLPGRHHSLDGAQPGPAPAHPIGIWVGSYKPRMLELTGRLGDGWIPSSTYASPDEIRDLVLHIEAGAATAGRQPGEIRRWYNIAGSFADRPGGFLHGPPRLWVEQLTDLALTQGLSGFILAPGAAAESDLRRFAEEVAPAVREAVAFARGTSVIASHDQLDLAPGERTTGREVDLDASTRPRARRYPSALESGPGRSGAEALIYFHENLRAELEQVRSIIERVATGQTHPGAARSLINRMSMRQNYWSLGAFCASYCHVVAMHHTVEDERMFVDLRTSDAELGPVLDRLSEEHELIAGVLTRLDRALVAMVTDPDQLSVVRAEFEHLTEVLLSHLDYEEEELLEPIVRLGVVV